MKLNQLDLIVQDVPTATAFFHTALGLEIRFGEERFAELDAGGFTLMLSPDALVPTRPAAGTILHFQVEDVSVAVERARSYGAKVLMEPTVTDWGTYSALLAGPEESVIDLYSPVKDAQTEG